MRCTPRYVSVTLMHITLPVTAEGYDGSHHLCMPNDNYNVAPGQELLISKGLFPLFSGISLKEKQSPSTGPSLDLSGIKRTNEGFICPYCPRKIYDFTDLMRHIRTHTGEKPFACEICHQRFSQTSSCYRHKRTVHKVK